MRRQKRVILPSIMIGSVYSRIEKIESTKKDIYNSSGMKTKG